MCVFVLLGRINQFEQCSLLCTVCAISLHEEQRKRKDLNSKTSRDKPAEKKNIIKSINDGKIK